MDDLKDQELLWDDWWSWPSPPPGFVFLIPAFQQIGARLCGDQWRDELPPQNYYEVPPENLNEASGDDQQAARRFLSEHGQYKPNANLKEHAENPIELNPIEWEDYFISIMSLNQEIDETNENLNRVAKFLGDRIFLEQLTPFLMSANGGGWHQSNRDDWIVPRIDHLRQRIQSGRMTPGHPESTDGSHWIFLRQVELDTTLEWIESNRIAVDPTSPNTQKSADTANVNGKPRTTAKMLMQAINIAADEIQNNPNITRRALIKIIERHGLTISDNSFYKTVWPQGRSRAGLNPKARAGNKPQN